MIRPHGGELINREATGDYRKKLLAEIENLYKIEIEDRYVSDCELIANGAYSPLKGFLHKDDVMSVLDNLRLTSGIIWSIPIVLPVDDKNWHEVKIGDKIGLWSKREGKPIALLELEDKYTLDIDYFTQKVFKTTEIEHPGVKWFKESSGKFIGGKITLVNRPARENIDPSYYLDPVDTRRVFNEKGWNTIVAFQTRNPIHRAHEYLIKTALEANDGVLIHPIVGETKPDDVPADVRMRCYEVLIENYFNKDHVFLSVLPMAMRYAGPREALHHMIIRKNYGCTHMIMGRDHAGVGNYYGTYEAQEFVSQFQDEIGIKPIKFEHAFYCTKCGNMATRKTCPHSSEFHIFLSGTKVRAMLREGKRPPVEFSRPEVADVLVEYFNFKLDT